MTILLVIQHADHMLGDGPHALLVQHDLLGEQVQGEVLYTQNIVTVFATRQLPPPLLLSLHVLTGDVTDLHVIYVSQQRLYTPARQSEVVVLHILDDGEDALVITALELYGGGQLGAPALDQGSAVAPLVDGVCVEGAGLAAAVLHAVHGGTDKEGLLAEGVLLVAVHLVDLAGVLLQLIHSNCTYIHGGIEGGRVGALSVLLTHDLLQEVAVDLSHFLTTMKRLSRTYRKQSSLFSSSVGISADVSLT